MTKNQNLSAKLFLFFLLLVMTSCRGGDEPQVTVRDQGRLVVAMDSEMPGYFVYGGENYGYQYDLFKAYAKHLGVELEIVDGKRPSEYARMLEDGRVDIVTTLSDRMTGYEPSGAVPIYNTSYVLLSGRKNAVRARKAKDFRLVPFIRDGRVLISSGFKSSRAYDMLLDSLSTSEVYVSSRSSFELIEALGDGKYDYLICEMSEAQLGCAFQKNVEQVCRFSEAVPLSAVVSQRDTGLQADFEAWLSRFRCSEEYAMLNYLYFEKGIVRQVMGEGLRAARAGGISKYDDLFREIAAKEGYDWRLLSAIAYSESRFNPSLVSPRGARGLMQIMPRVARQFDVAGNVMDPANNVLLAVKVLAKIERSLDFAPGTPQIDRTRIVLACYNGGIGHVTDARNLARKYGDNPDSWADVSRYLTLKSDPAYASDDVVRNGRFSGRQTLAFVDGVIGKYAAYCSSVKR